MGGAKSTIYNPEAEREKILNGTYSSRIVQGRQRKHIPGSKEFCQKKDSMRRDHINDEPAILTVDAHALVQKYKGTGTIFFGRGKQYPREKIKADGIIGKTWLCRAQQYLETDSFEIIYSGIGVHVVPIYPIK